MSDTMSEIPCQSHSCLRGCSLVSGRVYGLRACFTPRVKHALTFICGGRGSEMGHTVGRPPGGLTEGRGRGFLGLGGLRACEGV